VGDEGFIGGVRGLFLNGEEFLQDAGDIKT
jgi:hypothetical protein